MEHYFSLNNRYINLYYSLLLFTTIVLFHELSNIFIWKDYPSNKKYLQIFIITIAIIFFHIAIDPSVNVKIIDEKHNNDHILS